MTVIVQNWHDSTLDLGENVGNVDVCMARGGSVNFRKLPAALLAESLSQTGCDHGRRFGVELADLVASVVVLGVREIGIASLRLASRRVGRPRLHGPLPPVQPVHEIILRREVRSASQIQPDSRSEIHGPTYLLALRHQHEPLTSVSAASSDGIKRQHGERLRRRVRRRGSVGAWVIEREGVVVVIVVVVVTLALGDLDLVRVKVMSEGGGRVVGVLRRRQEAIAESILGVSIVLENVMVADRVGSRSRFVLIGREHDRGRVTPFIFQHNFLFS